MNTEELRSEEAYKIRKKAFKEWIRALLRADTINRELEAYANHLQDPELKQRVWRIRVEIAEISRVDASRRGKDRFELF